MPPSGVFILITLRIVECPHSPFIFPFTCSLSDTPVFVCLFVFVSDQCVSVVLLVSLCFCESLMVTMSLSFSLSLTLSSHPLFSF